MATAACLVRVWEGAVEACDPLSLSLGWDAAACSEDSDAIRVGRCYPCDSRATRVRAGGRDLRSRCSEGRRWTVLCPDSIRCVRT
jgi:hypothetical protein